MSDTKHQSVLATLAAQRNNALDTVADLNGVIAEQAERIAELEAEVAKLKPEQNG